MTNPIEFARHILLSTNIEEKLISFDGFKKFDISTPTLNQNTLLILPGREQKIEINFSKQQKVKFPRIGGLKDPVNKAKALHFFANHELLALELMALALIKYPHNTKEHISFKNSLIKTIEDEQKHFQLYRNEIRILGYDFGDFPINSFFWKKISPIETTESFVAVMSLTFENANLDFALQFQKIFAELGDIKISQVLQTVYEEEISHVARGVKHLNTWRKELPLWDYYLNLLPYPITAARAKGPSFDHQGRIKAKLGPHFINQLLTYEDNYAITARRSWKASNP